MGDVEAMNEYMNCITSKTLSVFDTGRRAPGKVEPELVKKHDFALEGKNILIG